MKQFHKSQKKTNKILGCYFLFYLCDMYVHYGILGAVNKLFFSLTQLRQNPFRTEFTPAVAQKYRFNFDYFNQKITIYSISSKKPFSNNIPNSNDARI